MLRGPLGSAFALDLFLMLSVTVVEHLDQPAHSAERGWLSNFGNLVLQAVRKTHVEAMPKGGIAPVNLNRKLLEFSEVSSAGFVLLHSEHGKLHFCITGRIVNAKVVLQDLFKLITSKRVPEYFP